MAQDLQHPLYCVNNNLHSTARAVNKVYAKFLAPLNLKRAQFSVLAMLVALGDSSIAKLADGLELDRTTLSRIIKPLLTNGLLKSRPGKTDAREKVISITPAGRARFVEALGLWKEAQAEVLDAFGDERWRTMLAELEALRRAVRKG
jgi:DNA-binding MarR family transcriptional regulator